MKVFWSWQSDTPGKIGRFLIRDALKEAIAELKSMPEIEEPVREALHLDHDREGISGSPELVRTILDIIDASDVVVADVTLVGICAPKPGEESPKKLINSNVAIELGYALRALTFRKVLMVFNAHYGRHEELPFDLRHRGGAIVFQLASEANRASIEAERKILVQRFVGALKLCLTEAVAAIAPDPFPETPQADARATYFRANEPLARIGVPQVDQVEFTYPKGPLCHLRLIPTVRRTGPLPLATHHGCSAEGAVTDTPTGNDPLLSESLRGHWLRAGISTASARCYRQAQRIHAALSKRRSVEHWRITHRS